MLLALDQRQLGDVVAMQEQDVEGKEHQIGGAALVHGSLQAAERRQAIGTQSHR
jgi:hypothetical protein